MCCFDFHDRMHLPAITRSQIPNTNATVPAARAQQGLIRWVPGHALHSAGVAAKSMERIIGEGGGVENDCGVVA